jgi:hypothetical protein
MLNSKTYTPDLNAEAAILPLLPDHLRAQALRLLAQLLEHGCYTEKASAGEAGQSQVGLGGSRPWASQGDFDVRPLSVKNLRMLQWLPNRDGTQSQVSKLPLS